MRLIKMPKRMVFLSKILRAKKKPSRQKDETALSNYFTKSMYLFLSHYLNIPRLNTPFSVIKQIEVSAVW
jgi:hypothetical protein